MKGWNTENWAIFHLKTKNNENLMRTSIENNENTEKYTWIHYENENEKKKS